jgi:hypothetical protein
VALSISGRTRARERESEREIERERERGRERGREREREREGGKYIWMVSPRFSLYHVQILFRSRIKPNVNKRNNLKFWHLATLRLHLCKI